MAWPNGPASSRKGSQVELLKRLALGDQTDSQVSSQVHANNGINVTQLKLALICQTGDKKLALTCVLF